jgi:hypothetical protein
VKLPHAAASASTPRRIRGYGGRSVIASIYSAVGPRSQPAQPAGVSAGRIRASYS